ncbi:MAG: DUF2510 domain-containing protein [Aeromicrobium sp.]
MQPTHAGWYWDPTGRPGLFRWWDGVVWTRHVTPDRTDPAPEPLRLAAADDDGLLHAGRLAFPLLPEPWRQCPAYPGFTDAVAQERGVGRTGRGEYDALVVIGSVPERLQAGSSQEIAETLCAEILSTFYPAERPAGPTTGIEVDVDGHTAWRLDVRLDVDDTALEFAREDLLLVVLDDAVLYASLPDAPGVPAADDIVGQLRVFAD